MLVVWWRAATLAWPQRRPVVEQHGGRGREMPSLLALGKCQASCRGGPYQAWWPGGEDLAKEVVAEPRRQMVMLARRWPD